MTDLHCGQDTRRADTRQAPLFGLDYVEVDAAQTGLEVFFLGRAPPGLTRGQLTITGGRPVTIVKFKLNRQRDPGFDDWLQLTVDRPGDAADYALSIIGPNGAPPDGFDPRYASVTFNFKASCGSDLDCRTDQVCPPAVRPAPPIDYLAKDFASFQRLMLDRLATTLPGWSETHAPDIGVMLVELMAYVADQLSYQQDAVSAEAYLGTARQRISLRRHARLVDYRIGDGCNARAFVVVGASRDVTLPASGYFLSTPVPGVPPGAATPAQFATGASDVTVFEPLLPGPSLSFPVKIAHVAIPLYGWGERECCLPRGATSATLLDAWGGPPADDGSRPRLLSLAVGDFLLLEEVRGPLTGDPADADPTHRAVVRLTRVTPGVDPLYDVAAGGRPVVEITWCSDDALAFPLCLSARTQAPDCLWRDDISLARGNVLLVDQGLSTTEALGAPPVGTTLSTCSSDCAPASQTQVPARFTPILSQLPLTRAQPLPRCGCAGELLVQDPALAMPQALLHMPIAGTDTLWRPVADLLESGPDDHVFVAEIDDAGQAHLRFGDGTGGAAPPGGASVTVAYRVGNGPTGNVGAETITQLILLAAPDQPTIFTARNPLPATGGQAPQSAESIRQFAPYAFMDTLERAITAADYAALAADDDRRREERLALAKLRPPAWAPWRTDGDPRRLEDEDPGRPAALPDPCLTPFQPLQGARATFAWTGSWYEARVAIDPLGADDPAAAPCDEVAAYLEPYRRIGQDLAVQPPIYAPMDLGLSVCVAPTWQRGHVEAAILAVLDPGMRADGTKGLFDPDNLTFAQAVHASPIVAAIQALPGVVEIQITRLARFVPGAKPPTAEPEPMPPGDALTFGAFEIARLDNDPSSPGHGRITLTMRGGR